MSLTSKCAVVVYQSETEVGRFYSTYHATIQALLTIVYLFSMPLRRTAEKYYHQQPWGCEM